MRLVAESELEAGVRMTAGIRGTVGGVAGMGDSGGMRTRGVERPFPLLVVRVERRVDEEGAEGVAEAALR
jgi:hypothetical protein